MSVYSQLSGRPANKPKGKGGRPSSYTPEVAKRICDHIASGGYATELKRFGLPSEATVCEWQIKYPEFAELYARAREQRAETFAAQIVEIADTEEDPNRARVRIDARKWIASKLFPRMYGERQTVEINTNISIKAALDEAQSRVIEGIAYDKQDSAQSDDG